MTGTLKIDYKLPEDRIALYPSEPRDSCRLLVYKIPELSIEDVSFSEIAGYFSAGDVIAINNSKVIKARIFGRKEFTGGKVEFLLVRKENNFWRSLARPVSRLRPGTKVIISSGYENTSVIVSEILSDGEVYLDAPDDILDFGIVPLPPYIVSHRTVAASDEKSYQSIFASKSGSIAAPTSSLHFTEKTISSVREAGAEFAALTLHVGPGTFRADYDRPSPEFYSLDENSASRLNSAERICACGTTVMRTLETVYKDGNFRPSAGETSVYIERGHEFSNVDMFLTNFHLPGTPLLELVAAYLEFMTASDGKELLMKIYGHAMASGYSFLSYGDAMLIINER